MKRLQSGHETFDDVNYRSHVLKVVRSCEPRTNADALKDIVPHADIASFLSVDFGS